MKILVTGGSGRLGTELKKLYPKAFFPTRQELNITNPKKRYPASLIIHCAGYTNVAKAEKEKDLCYNVNVRGTENMLKMYKRTPFVFISTEYAGNPINYYSLTKRVAERYVIQHPHHLIIRTLFKPRPYPFDRAWIDQFTMGDYVDVIAELIRSEINNWDNETSNIVYIGTGRKTIYQLAKQTNPKVKKASIDIITNVILPRDYL